MYILFCLCLFFWGFWYNVLYLIYDWMCKFLFNFKKCKDVRFNMMRYFFRWNWVKLKILKVSDCVCVVFISIVYDREEIIIVC